MSASDGGVPLLSVDDRVLLGRLAIIGAQTMRSAMSMFISNASGFSRVH